ncbi:hypothetical protein M501DRAFT_988930 [Patellaria atrata CBS 101060]|uniref:Uncharacterized protein n=1 Tax=Patellaria atrata CBS 101060 TaxID=1346257 RepID=A0A9P4S529_9PEZI|nr:hypothetical protein M501DRAFT_988930 [Patellaria atrata CBS 101060]
MTVFPNHDDYESVLSDVSRRMASSQLSRRHSRSSNGNSTPGRNMARIEKPRSTHGSPHGVERRRTTSNVKAYATLDDHFNMMFGSTDEQHTSDGFTGRVAATRPLSWHPSSSNLSTQPQFTSSSGRYHDGRSSEYFQSTATFAHDLPSGVPMMDQSNTNANFTPYDTLTNAFPHLPARTWNGSIDQPTDYFGISPYNSMQYPQPLPLHHMQLDFNPRTSSVHAQSEYLPIQHPRTPADEVPPTIDHKDAKESGPVLIGMGLYDPPEPYQPLLALGLQEPQGKGLKLEEPFQPPEQDDDEEDEGVVSSDDAESEDEEPPAPKMAEKGLPIRYDTEIHTNLSGHSFFFEDDDEAYPNEVVYGQWMHPVPSAQVAGARYGWI